MSKKITYAAVLPFVREDDSGVWFGNIDNSSSGLSDSEGRDNIPGCLVIPHAIWEANDKPESLTVGFVCGDISDELSQKDSLYKRLFGVGVFLEKVTADAPSS